jgi:uncharacterized membrane protein YkoI
MLAGGIAGLACGCASRNGAGTKKEKDVNVSIAELSAPARATVEKVTANGRVEKITKEKEKGRVVYDVEATIGGKHEEFLIADDDGTVLGTETSIDFASLPDGVRDAAVRYFGTSTGLKAMKGLEYGEISYEIEGPKNGKVVEVTFDDTGKKVK